MKKFEFFRMCLNEGKTAYEPKLTNGYIEEYTDRNGHKIQVCFDYDRNPMIKWRCTEYSTGTLIFFGAKSKKEAIEELLDTYINLIYIQLNSEQNIQHFSKCKQMIEQAYNDKYENESHGEIYIF